jgi:hypothetical protein
MKKEVIAIPGIRTPGATFNHVVKAGAFLYLRDLNNRNKVNEVYRDQNTLRI